MKYLLKFGERSLSLRLRNIYDANNSGEMRKMGG
jgi:hypothetical protein